MEFGKLGKYQVRGNFIKVLIVDDYPSIINILRYILEDEGFEVMSAANGQAGFITALFFKPDLVITDLNMPGQNGLEMMKVIRSFNPMVETIYMSGDFDSLEVYMQKEKDRFGVGILKKPFSREELFVQINKLKSHKVQASIQKYGIQDSTLRNS